MRPEAVRGRHRQQRRQQHAGGVIVWVCGRVVPVLKSSENNYPRCKDKRERWIILGPVDKVAVMVATIAVEVVEVRTIEILHKT